MKSGAKLSTDNNPPKNQGGGTNANAGGNFSNAGIQGKPGILGNSGNTGPGQKPPHENVGGHH
jgi:hypothetical protein